MLNGQMQLMVARQTDSKLSHTIRFPTSWQPWGDATAVVGALPGIVYDIAAAEVGGNVHYVAATNLGLFHTIRFSASPSWQPWGDIKAAAGAPGASVVNVAAAGIGGNLHVVVVRHTVPDTDILHTIRFPTSWQQWGNVETAAGPLTGFIWDIAAAAVGGNLHVVATNGTSIFHTIRFSTSWQAWGDVEAAVSELGSFWNLDAANVAGNLHLVAATRAGAGIQTDLFHTIRFSQSWQPWGNIESVVGDPGDVRTFGVA